MLEDPNPGCFGPRSGVGAAGEDREMCHGEILRFERVSALSIDDGINFTQPSLGILGSQLIQP